MSRAPLPPINFRALAEALLSRASELVPQWLPGGKTIGHEYFCGDLTGGPGSSVAVNLTNGRWGEFNGDQTGGDLLSLYAAIHELEMGQAALRVAKEEGLESVAGIVMGQSGDSPPLPPRPPKPPALPAKRDDREKWVPQLLVPSIAPKPTFYHPARRAEDILNKAEYRVDGHLLGYVVRFRTSDGGKEDIPYTWCVSETDGSAAWRWKTWPEPQRPLYYPGGQHPNGRTVIVVEGEIKADVLQALLDQGAPGVYCVVSWPGGSKAWPKAFWEWIKGCTVLLWPDCDSLREKLSRKEVEALNGDSEAIERAKEAKPFQPYEKQPGLAAMRGLGPHLRDVHGCTASMLPCEQPGVRPHGWDAKDAIQDDGWDFDRVLQFFGQATLMVEAAPPAPAGPPSSKEKGKKTDAGGDKGSEDDSELPWWLRMFINPNTGLVQMSRKTVITCLRNAPDLVDCLGFNELSGEVTARNAWPWRSEPGPVVDNDDLRLGDWISVKYKVPGAARAALTEAIHTVADSNPYHPVRDYLQGLQWDGKERLEKWLIHVLRIDHELLRNGDGKEIAPNPNRLRYLQMISKFWLIGMVARIMKPGCKFDYSLVIEGLTGRRKSTLLEVMAGKAYYSDTHFDIGGNKDGFDQLQGLWLYELSEMSALRKADSESVKAFFSSSSDRYRSSYGRYVQNHPRQCVIGCTTNKRQYLYDTTGNRRFWPVWVDQPIRIEWFVKWRDQLYAEALAKFRAGEAFAPTLEEEEKYFIPEQELRLVETGVQSELMRLLTREGTAGDSGGTTTQLNELTPFVTMSQLVRALGTDVGKSTTVLENQIRGWLEAQGWERARAGTGNPRPWGWRRPKGWPFPVPEDEQTESGPHGPGNDDDRHAQAVSAEDDDDLPI